MTGSLAEQITKFICRRGLGPESDPEESDPLLRDQPWLAGLYAASVLGRTAFGPNAGRRTTRTGDQIDPESMDAVASPRCASVNGFSLHANVALNATDRARFERLLRYCARPPVAVDRLEALPQLTTSIVIGFVEPQDPLTFLSTFLVLALVTTAAVLVPAWRASQLNPCEALRSE